MMIDPEQLNLFLQEYLDEDEPPDTKRESRKDPTPETGYLTCCQCSFINVYEYPKENWVCAGCKLLEENM